MPTEHRITPKQAAAPRSPSTSPGRRASLPGGPAARVLSLQRSAGNQAVTCLLGASQPAIQRLTVGVTDLDAALGTSRTGFLGAGRSTYAVIRKALAEYEAERRRGRATKAKLSRMLERLDRDVTAWLNNHRGSLDAQNSARRAVLRRLSDELAPERAALSQGQAQDVYVENLADPRSAHAFEAATPGARAYGKKARAGYADELRTAGQGQAGDRLRERMKLVQDKGLSPAEHAAIAAYTEGDYDYINPVTANNPGWLAGRKAHPNNQAQGWVKASDRVLREEGALHAGVASAGLRKLDVYDKPTFRGETMSESRFRAEIAQGSTITFPSLKSTSKDAMRSAEFIGTNVGPGSDVGVFWAYTNAGGRDVQALSAQYREAEVMLLPGSTFVVLSVVEIGQGGGPGAAHLSGLYSQLLASRQSGHLAKARKCFLVEATAVPKAPAPGAPAQAQQQTPGAPPVPWLPAHVRAALDVPPPSTPPPPPPAFWQDIDELR